MYWSQVRVLAGPPKKNRLLNSKFKIGFIALIIFTIFLLIEGFFWHYSSKLSYFCFDTLSFSNYCQEAVSNPDMIGLDTHVHKKYTIFESDRFGYSPIIWNENGLIETLQILFLLISIFYFFQILLSKTREKKNLFYIILIFYFVCLLYYFFEEISWGQHYIGWKSSDFFMEYNNQKETNLHNISNLFDQLPRSLLSIWCSLSFVIIIFFKKFNSNEDYHIFILPSKKLKYISYLLLIFILPDLILDLLIAEVDYTKTLQINFTDIYVFFSLNFIRLSEYQELLFTFYILNHSIFFKNYLERKI